MWTAVPAHAAPLTEADAVRAALSNPHLDAITQADTAEARARGRTRNQWSNPQLSYTREQLLGAQTLGEDYVGLAQTFDVSGRRGLARDAARHRVRAAEATAEQRQAEVTAEVRRRFYTLLLAQRRLDVLSGWRDQVQLRLDAVTKRELAGDAAAYERLRLVRERGHVDALLDRERASLAGAWAELRGLTGRGETESPALDGVLLPDDTTCPDPSVVARAPGQRAVAAEADALRVDGRVASRWWVPNPTVGLGYKGVEQVDGGRAHGLFVSLSMPLPAIVRGQAQRERAEAERSATTARAALALHHDTAAVQAACAEVASLRQGVQRMHQEDTASARALIAAAEAGYRGGEVSVLELVDAYRTATEAQLLRLELSMQARDAEIELRRRTGDPS